MVKAMQNKKSVIPCPCKKDCADRCDGCKLECKKFEVYEKIKSAIINSWLFNKVRCKSMNKVLTTSEFVKNSLYLFCFATR